MSTHLTSPPRASGRVAPGRQDGHAMIIMTFVVVLLAGVMMATLTDVTSFKTETRAKEESLEALYMAEIGVQAAVRDLNEAGTGNVGTEAAPVDFNGGRFWVTAEDRGDGTFIADGFGTVGSTTRVVRAVIARVPDPFHHAVFAGNSSGDPTYVMEFAGVGTQADWINGDIYSGQDVEISDDASITGDIHATGTIAGASGHSGMNLPVPDIGGTDYASKATVDVVAEFAAATFGSAPMGGDAWQLPASNPAHVFRKNPSDRTHLTGATAKDDFFFEDPHEPHGGGADQVAGSDAHAISLTNDVSDGAPNRQIFYIEGNLWVESPKTLGYRLQSLAEGNQITIAVKGNIYLTDNLFYSDLDNDAIALIAIKDEAEPDSGNIYFGDPTFGTLQTMQAFMFAENDFRDNHLAMSGSAVVNLHGSMSAGNQVNIDRDLVGGHSRLAVDFDSRLRDGTIELPGLPSSSRTLEYAVVLWQHASESSVEAPMPAPTEPEPTTGSFEMPDGTVAEQFGHLGFEMFRLLGEIPPGAFDALNAALMHLNSAGFKNFVGDAPGAISSLETAKGKVTDAVAAGLDSADGDAVKAAMDGLIGRLQ